MNLDLTSDLDSEQMDTLTQLKRRMEDDLKPQDLKDDSLFLRFLRAREYDISKSELMLRNHMRWRREENIDTIVEDHLVPEVGKYFPMSRIGFDKDGCPVRVFCFGNMDVKGLLKSATLANCCKTVISYLETDSLAMKEQSKKLGKNVETWSYIFDFEHYKLSQATHKQSVELIAHLFSIYEANYPERLKNAIIINASIYFTIIFAVVKPLLHGNTMKKVKIFGTDGWKEELLKFIDPEVLPMYLGGTRTDMDGDPRCPSVVIPGGLVPQHFYFRSPQRRLAFQPGVKKYSVSRKSTINIVLAVLEPGSHIQWEFETESRDIGFGLYYREDKDIDNKKPRELIPKQRVEAHLHSEEGVYQCDIAGTYILMFDNSYSWLAQKEVFCRTSVITPENRDICVPN